MKSTYEVIVVGGGRSGLAAALGASKRGADVLVLEKSPKTGGSQVFQTHKPGTGSFFGPFRGTTSTSLEGRKMSLSSWGTSAAELVCRAAVEELLLEEGRVVGVRAQIRGQSHSFTATRGVVLATGDYAGSPELVAEFLGPGKGDSPGKGDRRLLCEAHEGPFRQKAPVTFSGIDPEATGDGHRMARAVGARLVQMERLAGPVFWLPPLEKKPVFRDFSWLEPFSRFSRKWTRARTVKRLLARGHRPETSLLDQGALLVNAGGRRFTHELVSPDREYATASLPERFAYLLLDEPLFAACAAADPPVLARLPGRVDVRADDYARHRPDLVVTADGLEALAQRAGFHPETLLQTVEAFNRFASGISADPFGRTDSVRRKHDGRWLLLGPVSARWTAGLGHVAIDERFAVLDHKNRPIPGLFAVGHVGLGGEVSCLDASDIRRS